MRAVPVLVLLIALTGCTSQAGEAVPAVGGSTASPPPAAVSDDEREALLAALKAVDGRLAADPDAAVAAARGVCDDIAERTPSALLVSNTRARFVGGTLDRLTVAQGTTILRAVRTSFCDPRSAAASPR